MSAAFMAVCKCGIVHEIKALKVILICSCGGEVTIKEPRSIIEAEENGKEGWLPLGTV